MSKKSKNKLGNKHVIAMVIAAAIIVVIGGVLYSVSGSDNVGDLDAFAQCLEESGAKFYGAFWCPHCESQKRLFGKSKKYLPYIECSTTSKTQTPECKKEVIQSYPTWEFEDGERKAGELSLNYLAHRTGCELPN